MQSRETGLTAREGAARKAYKSKTFGYVYMILKKMFLFSGQTHTKAITLHVMLLPQCMGESHRALLEDQERQASDDY